MSEKKQITEEMDVHKDWYERARKMTMKELPEFIRHLNEDFIHDYGTRCHAVAASAVATAWASCSVQGLTVFQAGAVMWEFITHWNQSPGDPLVLLNQADAAYPQYEYKFKSITTYGLEKVREKAAEGLKENIAHPDVIAHWKKIQAGEIPFGLRVRDE